MATSFISCQLSPLFIQLKSAKKTELSCTKLSWKNKPLIKYHKDKQIFMEEVQSVAISPGPQATSSSSSSTSSTRPTSGFKRNCISIKATFLQGFRYIKAIFVGQAKKLTARNEREAAEADLLASKMQVDAADEAENTRKQINNKSY